MTTTLKTPIRPHLHRFTWGEAQIVTILDGEQVREPLQPPFLMGKEPDELAAIAAAHRLPHDRFVNSYTPTLVDTGSELVLFDVGFGEAGRGEGPNKGAGLLTERLKEAGYAPEDIDVVVLTHMHPDHILGVSDADGLTYPNARHMVGRVEFDAWSSGEGIPESRAQNRVLFNKLIAPLEDQLTFIRGGDTIAKGIVAEEAFGHSPGHMMFRVTSAGKEVLIWGDVANHYAFSVGYPDVPVGFDDIKLDAIATRKRVLGMVADAGTLVVGHHMPFPAVGYVERTSDSFQWVPAAYQLRV